MGMCTGISNVMGDTLLTSPGNGCVQNFPGDRPAGIDDFEETTSLCEGGWRGQCRKVAYICRKVR